MADLNAHVSKTIKIGLVKSDLMKEPPAFEIPREAYIVPIRCTLLGFDNSGHPYVRFHDKGIEEKHFDMMAKINMVYGNAHPRFISIYNVNKLTIGYLVVAKVQVQECYGTVDESSSDSDDNEKYLFIRGRILQIERPSNMITVVDIDDQMKFTVPISSLFWIFDHFIKSPMMSIKCRMRFLERFEGTRAIPEASIHCPTESTEMYGMVIKDSENSSVPTIQLYKDQKEAMECKWSYNFDLLKVLMSYNDRPLLLKEEMKLLQVRVSHALPNGHVWIQFQSGLMSIIANLQPSVDLKEMSIDIINEQVRTLIKEGCDKYVVRYEDQKYYRVCILKPLELENAAEFVVEFMDYGIRMIVGLEDLLPFELFAIDYQDIPPQAFRAKLKTIRNQKINLSESDLKRLIGTKKKQEVIICEESKKSDPFPTVIVFFLPLSQNNAEDEKMDKDQEVNAGTIPDHAELEFPVEYPNDRPSHPAFIYSTRYRGRHAGLPHWKFFKKPNRR